MAWTRQEGWEMGVRLWQEGMYCAEQSREEEGERRVLAVVLAVVLAAVEQIDAGEVRTICTTVLVLAIVCLVQIYGVYGTRITSLFKHSTTKTGWALLVCSACIDYSWLLLLITLCTHRTPVHAQLLRGEQ